MDRSGSSAGDVALPPRSEGPDPEVERLRFRNSTKTFAALRRLEIPIIAGNQRALRGCGLRPGLPLRRRAGIDCRPRSGRLRQARRARGSGRLLGNPSHQWPAQGDGHDVHGALHGCRGGPRCGGHKLPGRRGGLRGQAERRRRGDRGRAADRTAGGEGAGVQNGVPGLRERARAVRQGDPARLAVGGLRGGRAGVSSEARAALHRVFGGRVRFRTCRSRDGLTQPNRRASVSPRPRRSRSGPHHERRSGGARSWSAMSCAGCWRARITRSATRVGTRSRDSRSRSVLSKDAIAPHRGSPDRPRAQVRRGRPSRRRRPGSARRSSRCTDCSRTRRGRPPVRCPLRRRCLRAATWSRRRRARRERSSPRAAGLRCSSRRQVSRPGPIPLTI